MGQQEHLEALREEPASGGPARWLFVLVHGYGADGEDLIDLAPVWARVLPDAAFVAPHGPDPCLDSPLGRQWFSISDRTPAKLEAGVRAAAARLEAFVDAELARLGLPPEALVLMGFSQGAMTALHLGLRRPQPPRAVLAYSGALLAAGRLAAEIRARPPVLLVHGEADEVVPAGASHLAEAELHAQGVPVQALYLPGLGHAIDDAGLAAGALFLQRVFARD